MTFVKIALIAGAVSMICGSMAMASPSATIVFNNTSATSDGSDPIANSNNGGAGPLAQSFSTGGAAFDLADLALGLSGVDSSRGSFTIDVVANGEAGPSSTVIASFGSVLDSALTAIPVFYEFSLASAVLLSADTTYWVELIPSGTLSTTASWSYATDTSGTGVADQETFNNYNDDGSPGVASAADGLYQMCVSNTDGACAVTLTSQEPPSVQTPSPPSSPDPMPEPTTFALLAIGAAGLTTARRRRAALGH